MAKFAGFVLLSVALVLATAVLARGYAILVLVMVLLVWAILGQRELSALGKRAEARRQELAQRIEPQLPPEALDFLARLDAHLDLSTYMRAEVRAEMADHLSDSIAAIAAEGLDPGAATREALARLGRPEELARQLRRAHLTTRRLLAGAAGGVWSAGIGAVQGYVVAATIALLALITFTVALRHVIHIDDPNQLALGTVFGAALAWVPASVAGRRAVRACSEISGRPTAQLGRWWALGGLFVLGWLVMFVTTVQQSWLVAPFELAIPLAFAAGALVRVEARFPAIRGRWVAISAVAILLVGTVGLQTSGVSSSGSSWDWTYTDDSIGWNHVAPSADLSVILDYSEVWGAAPTIDVQDPAMLSPYHDLRLEAWRATAYPGAPSGLMLGLLDTSYSTPYATAPAVVGADGTIDDHLNVSHSRTSRWWIFLTGVAGNGQRYWLGYRPIYFERDFTGTIWDWLTASS